MVRTNPLNLPRWLVAASLVALSSFATCQTSDQLLRLASPATTDAERTELIARGSHDPRMTSGLSRALPSMLLAARNDSVIESEAKLAGALKIESTVPALISLLAHPISMMGSMYMQTELLVDPVARALYEIGPPALPALAEALKSTNYLQRTRAIQVLVLTDSDASRAILQAHIPSEPDASLRHSIELSLDWQTSHPGAAFDPSSTQPHNQH